MSLVLRLTPLPPGLKKNQVERRVMHHGPPINFILPPLSTRDTNQQVHKIEIEIFPKVKEQVTIFTGGIPKFYLSFFQTIKGFIHAPEGRH